MRGGKNRTHGRLEEVDRLDSFDTRFTYFMLSGCRTMRFEKFDDDIRLPDGAELRLDYMNGAAGKVPFFRCPECGERVRFLYLPDYTCRKCRGLNYACQQVTRGSYQAAAALPTKLEISIPPEDYIEEYEPQEPKGMSRKRWERYRSRIMRHYQRYQQAYIARLMRFI